MPQPARHNKASAARGVKKQKPQKKDKKDYHKLKLL